MSEASSGASSELLDPLSPDLLADPFPTYRRLQEQTPVVWHPELYAWVLTGYEGCREVLRDSVKFTRDRRKLGRPVPPEWMTIQSLDPPDQLALRRAVTKALHRTDVAASCRDACDVLERCLANQRVASRFDFMTEVAAPAAMRFACRLVGVPERGHEAYLPIFLGITRAMDSAVDPRRGRAGVDATEELNAIIDQARAQAPPGSFMHELSAVPGVADMAHAYVRNTISATFNAAYSTAHSALGSFVLLALERPGLAARIADADDPATGVQELLRFTSPAQSTGRYAACDLMLGGVEIRQNDPIITLMAAANRDPRQFERPDEIVLDRTPNPHLAFAAGPHRCVGAKPAVQFLCRFVERLARWEPAMALAGVPTWLDTATLRCIDRLPLLRRDTQGVALRAL